MVKQSAFITHMSAHPEFTVIIPTRERADVLGPALRTVVNQDYDKLRILVSDNYSNDFTRDVVDSFDDPRISYINTGRRLSMSHNWEYALSHVDDGWVAFIGDDDGLLPGAVAKAAEIAREFGVKAIGSRNAAYSWPQDNSPYGRLSVNLNRGVDVFSAKDRLLDVLQGKGAYSALPMLYTGGFVEFSLIAKVRAINGVFNHCINPDVFSAVAIAKFTDRFVYSHEPLAIGGSSKHSGGTSYFLGGNALPTTESPAKKFIFEPNIPIHPDLALSDGEPLPPSIELMVYEAILNAEFIPPPLKSMTSLDEQLAMAIGKAKSRNLPKVTEWCKRLSERQGLDYQAIRRRARLIRWWEKLKKNFTATLEKQRTLVIAGTEDTPLRDVYEASKVIDDILQRLANG